MPVSAEALVDRIIHVVRTRLPAGVTADYFDTFVRRNRTALVANLAQQLAARGTGSRDGARSSGDYATETYAQLPDSWAASQRTAASLAAMRLAARQRSIEMTSEDRATLAVYSGWGGLWFQAVADQFPTGFPVPEERGLIHEYYTPTKVAREVARVIQPLLPALPTADRTVLALDPSAGIGRFVLPA